MCARLLGDEEVTNCSQLAVILTGRRTTKELHNLQPTVVEDTGGIILTEYRQSFEDVD